MDLHTIAGLPADATRFSFPERHPDRPGPWADEPDKVQWVDTVTGLDCLAVRSLYTGAWCGYVGVPPGHPWHSVGHREIEARAHNGITYASLCAEEQELPDRGICHTPGPDRSADVWWVGFHCSGGEDLAPFPTMPEPLWTQVAATGEYRALDFVVGVTHILAAQARIAARPTPPPAPTLAGPDTG